MSDLLADRFLAIADLADDGDWREVRRRARPAVRRWQVTLLVATAAAVVAAVALAANDGWVFSRAAYAEPSFSRSFTFQGASWSVAGYLTSDGEVSCFRLGPKRTGGAAPMTCRVHLETPPGLASAPEGTTIGYDHRAGQVWFGDAPSRVARVEITDSRGKKHWSAAVVTPTLPEPTNRFRLWLILLPSSTAISVAGYDRHGKLLYRESPGARGETPVVVH
jgi:hypothetical protein